MNPIRNKMCLHCKHAWLDKQERAFHRLNGKPFLFECLLTRCYFQYPINEYMKCSVRKHNCEEYELCP